MHTPVANAAARKQQVAPPPPPATADFTYGGGAAGFASNTRRGEFWNRGGVSTTHSFQYSCLIQLVSGISGARGGRSPALASSEQECWHIAPILTVSLIV